MRNAIGFGDPWHQRYRPLPPRHFAVPSCARITGLSRQDQLRLPGPDQIDVNFGQELGVEQCAVLGAAGIVDRIARAEIVQPVRHARMLAARQQQSIHQPVAQNRLPLGAVKLGIDEADVERSVVDDERRIADEFKELLDHFREQRLAGKELAGQAMHGKRFGRHVALGIDVAVKGVSRRHAVVDLDAADLDQPVAAQRVKASGFSIENDFAHGFQEPSLRRITLAAAAS